jgi:hypothetical protein
MYSRDRTRLPLRSTQHAPRITTETPVPAAVSHVSMHNRGCNRNEQRTFKPLHRTTHIRTHFVATAAGRHSFASCSSFHAKFFGARYHFRRCGRCRKAVLTRCCVVTRHAVSNLTHNQPLTAESTPHRPLTSIQPDQCCCSITPLSIPRSTNTTYTRPCTECTSTPFRLKRRGHLQCPRLFPPTQMHETLGLVDDRNFPLSTVLHAIYTPHHRCRVDHDAAQYAVPCLISEIYLLLPYVTRGPRACCASELFETRRPLT